MKKMSFVLLVGSSLAFGNSYEIESFDNFSKFFGNSIPINTSINTNNNDNNWSVNINNKFQFSVKEENPENNIKKDSNYIFNTKKINSNVDNRDWELSKGWEFPSFQTNTIKTEYDSDNNKTIVKFKSGFFGIKGWSFAIQGDCANESDDSCKMEINNSNNNINGVCIVTPNLHFSIGNVDCSNNRNSQKGGGGSNPSPTPSIEHGYFDAWNDDHNISDRNITTKISGNGFRITIASISEDNTTLEKKDGIKIRYLLVDNNNGKTPINSNDIRDITGGVFDASEKEKNASFKFIHSKAYKNLSVEFKVCSTYNRTGKPHKYTLYTYDDCKKPDGNYSECSSNDNPNKCIRKFYSSDSFAIRPYKFEISASDSKADNNISNISIKAVNQANGIVKNYNVSSEELNLNAFDSNPNVKMTNMNYSFQFENGIAHINYIKYPEVGKIALYLSEKNGSEFAKVDADDTPDNERFINRPYSISNEFRVIPDHFAIKDINVTNSSNSDSSGDDSSSNFTYFSSNLNSMSATLNARIVAENEANETTKNYSGGLYEKDVNFTIPFSTTPENIGLDKIKTQYGDSDIATNDNDKNISFTIKDGNFTNGEFNLSLKINFDRNPSKPINDFSLTLNDINVTDEDGTKNDETNDDNVKSAVSKNGLNFRYGKAEAEDVYTYKEDVVVPTHFYYYHNNQWILNRDHNNKSQGDVNSTYTSDDIKVTNLNEDSISEGTQNINVDASNIPSTPYKAVLHLGIAPWLWYSKDGKSYQAPDESHTDCATHPCSNIIINNIPSSITEDGWSGVSNNNERNNVHKNTIEIRRNKNNENNYHPINW